MTDDLEPPRKSVELQDPGAHELESSDADEHFSDASEGQKPAAARSGMGSPIPMTRVERVDDTASYGEVPGTPAYQMRMQDAVPDEVEIVPRSRSASRLRHEDRPTTPGGSPVPKTVVEKVDDSPSHGDVPGTNAHELRKADATPDIVLKAPDPSHRPPHGSPTAAMNRYSSGDEQLPPVERSPRDEDISLSSPSPASSHGPVEHAQEPPGDNGDGGNMGDEFDEFEEGGGEDDDDFGDFDEGFQPTEEAESAFDNSSFAKAPSPPPVPSPIHILNYDGLEDEDDVMEAMASSHLPDLFPALSESKPTPQGPELKSTFLSERSLSLWSQLVAPPPLQPPNWVRSRIRRLFLVSLGVPVDLDEILPASKQKKLVLPSIGLPGDRSPRPSAEGRAVGDVARLKQGNESSASVDSSARGKSKRRGPPPPPDLDTRTAAMMASTTEVALNNLTDTELKDHVGRLEDLQKAADDALEYWIKQRDSAIGDKEAFEGVIENLVKHAKMVRR
ncbi:hypothetical protein BDY21DRAFT_99499 [Lineolata rhizophorae]|uniref:Uncharacterized protein n=1 Tax=Lineolata rhizophorae TaxID=578093 RepID=A0A6A6NTL7_9PEZI|nr:hypothetical protein BDY21DRAFT_99499 [Lineolata rhizophorae]